MFSKFIMKSPGGKQIRFNNMPYKIPCEITVNTEAESISLEKYFTACGYIFEVQKVTKAANKKFVTAKASNIKPASSQIEPVSVETETIHNDEPVSVEIAPEQTENAPSEDSEYKNRSQKRKTQKIEEDSTPIE